MTETTTPTRRTEDAIEELKRGWRRDPIWDIEETEGYEAHREELLAYRQEMERTWNQEYEMRMGQDWLRRAKAAGLREGSSADAISLAALASAEALTRIAEVLETMLENDLVRGERDALAESARIWGSGES